VSLNKDITYTGVNTRTLYETPGGRVFQSREELDEEYDIDASVKDFESIAERFVSDSENVRFVVHVQ